MDEELSPRSPRHRQAELDRGFGEVTVPSGEDDRILTQRERGGEVHGVIAAQAELFGEAAGTPGERLIHSDKGEVGQEILEVGEGAGVLSLGQPPAPSRRCQGGESLGVGEDAGKRRVNRLPEFGGQLGALLGDYELDQRRGVEVETPRRGWASRSDTGLLASTRARRAGPGARRVGRYLICSPSSAAD